MPPLRERLHDMWLLLTMGGDPVATCYMACAALLAFCTGLLYTGLARAVWRWWLGV